MHKDIYGYLAILHIDIKCILIYNLMHGGEGIGWEK